MNSNYGFILSACERLKCKECNGRGEVIDAKGVQEVCRFCVGTGWKSGKPKKLVSQRVQNETKFRL